MAEDRAGQQLGNYRLIRRLGEGGFAEVYLGQHIYLKTEAAIKILHTRLTADDLDGFVSEAQTIARLKHPHIVRVLEFGVEGSIPFLVMDYAPHGTLRQRHRKGSILAPAVIVPYVKQVAEALHYAHEEKLVHRDVKPENMLIGERDEVLLSDFGIATVAQSSRYQGTQEVAGTVAYMAPEQVQGKPRPASDQYSLGIVVYEWLTGTRPFHGSFTEIATQHVLTPPPPLREKLPDIAPSLEEVVLTALAKDPKERFASVRAFATAFEQASQDAALHFAPTRVIPPSGPVALPGTISTPPPAAPPISSSPPTFNLPPPIAAPAGNDAAGITSTPPGWQSAFSSAPSAPTTMTGAPPSSQRSTAGISAPPVKESARPKRRSAWRKVLVASLVLILVLAAVGGTWLLVANPFQFHQEVTTGPDITSIHVGTGADSASGEVQGETDTFHVGNEIFVVFNGANINTTDVIEVSLLKDSNTLFHEDVQATSYAWTIVRETGIYKWVLAYNGHPEASITFQVV